MIATFEIENAGRWHFEKLQARERKERRLAKEPDPIRRFFNLECYRVRGNKLLFKDVYDRFVKSIGGEGDWTKQKFRKLTPKRFPIGMSTGGKLWIGNLPFDEMPVTGKSFVASGGRLVRES